MFNQAILPDTLRAIQLVAKIPIVQQSYLAGGTALALQIGHRVSLDLDFFTPFEFDEEQLSSELLKFPDFRQKNKAWRTIQGTVGKTQFSLFYYKNPLLAETQRYEGINLAGKKDIAAMKINALESRGSRRDFVDIYFLTRNYRLEEMLSFYDAKYGLLEQRWYSILRSLDYFEDADQESEMPRMLIPVDWEQVKRFFSAEARRLAREKLGL